jgi:hypothetical protein
MGVDRSVAFGLFLRASLPAVSWLWPGQEPRFATKGDTRLLTFCVLPNFLYACLDDTLDWRSRKLTGETRIQCKTYSLIMFI